MIDVTVSPRVDGFNYTVYVNKPGERVQCYVITFTQKQTDEVVKKAAMAIFDMGYKET